MQKDYYNNMSASEVADKIIAEEEAFINTDFDSLDFYQKCHYALDFSPLLHPILDNSTVKKYRQSFIKELVPELKRRAEAGDGFAWFVLSMQMPLDQEKKMEYLNHAFDAGFVPAGVTIIDELRHENREEEAVTYCERFEKMFTKQDCKDNGLYEVYSVLKDHVTGVNRSYIQKKCFLNSRKYIMAENKYALMFSIARFSIGLLTIIKDPQTLSDEDLFWATVNFKVLLYCNEKGVVRHENDLGEMLSFGVGCDVDLHMMKQVYLNIMSKSHPCKEYGLLCWELQTHKNIDDVETWLYSKFQNGNIEAASSLIAILALDEKFDRLNEVCTEVVERYPERAQWIFSEGYKKIKKYTQV